MAFSTEYLHPYSQHKKPEMPRELSERMPFDQLLVSPQQQETFFLLFGFFPLFQSETDWKKGSRGCSNCLIQLTYSVFQTERVRALSCLTPKGDGKAVHAPEQHPRDQVLHEAYK